MAKKKSTKTEKTTEPLQLKQVSIILKKSSFKDMTPSVTSLKGLGQSVVKTVKGFVKGTLPTNTLSFVVAENGLILNDNCLIISDIHGKRVMLPVEHVVLISIVSK